LEAFPDLTIVGEASSGEELLRSVAAGAWQPDVVLMDLLMPSGSDGIEATRRLREAAPQVRVVVLTSSADDARVIAALRAGAIGYVFKEAEPELLLGAVRSAAQGRAVLDPAIATAVLHGLHAAPTGRGAALTARELDVLRLPTRGLVNKQIAEALAIGEETAKTHVGNILAKLGVAHRTEAAVVALRRGVVESRESGERTGSVQSLRQQRTCSRRTTHDSTGGNHAHRPLQRHSDEADHRDAPGDCRGGGGGRAEG